MSEKDKDYQYLFDRLEAYMSFIEDELREVEKYPIFKRKKFLESFMVFYDGYLNIRNKLKDEDSIFPQSLHDKIMNNLEKIRKLAYEKEDYVFEMSENLENFEDGLTEIYYISFGMNQKTSELEFDIKRSLEKKCTKFFSDLNKAIARYEEDFKEKIPSSVKKKMEGIKNLLRSDFKIIVDGEKNLGPIEISCVDADAILDMYEKIKHMPDGEAKREEERKLARMHEIFSK